MSRIPAKECSYSLRLQICNLLLSFDDFDNPRLPNVSQQQESIVAIIGQTLSLASARRVGLSRFAFVTFAVSTLILAAIAVEVEAQRVAALLTRNNANYLFCSRQQVVHENTSQISSPSSMARAISACVPVSFGSSRACLDRKSVV